ncbi:23S rRNA (adenine(1618)-N(6))-methyltransferase RlmF [Parvicella tangerina]|uniref:Ribosomal RNA large subunit methyltransferase F n=1 Tax=Parvicella tangerina TaxID=2829795 RepID=A0A916JKN6_9FLAO|nr:23S rRNA (adenine(1618)-N(6))-methyltransferase RlmF [Parvicella tangerina]CAG5077244.1 Ribosomal RNA large subunit methyltransferase F [Parvicella tangerina]
MSSPKSKTTKSRLHKRNKNRDRYDLKVLVKTIPDLKEYVIPNKLGEDSVDFSQPEAVKLLNKAILLHDYGLEYWEFSDKNLTPPIPGRADYIHYMADLLMENNFGKLPAGNKITCVDIGVGASCIYPIIGVIEYGWNFIASDVDPDSINSAQNIVQKNAMLKGKVSCKLQHSATDIFYGIMRKDEKVDLTISNPPFHSSIEEARKGSLRKTRNLGSKDIKKPTLNFAGDINELVYPGGEYKFIHKMIRESEKFYKSCLWFSTIVSKQSNLKGIYKTLRKYGAVDVRTIPLGTGNKSSRIVAWTYLSREEQKAWREQRWD